MYVCICNAIADGSVQEAIADGNHSIAKVYKACGVTPQCGTCGERIQEMIDSHRAASFVSAAQEDIMVPA